jgi:integrase
MKTERVNLTRRVVDALPTPADKRTLTWDAHTRGLGVKVEPSGRKSYFWAKTVNSKLRWHAIGDVEDVTLERARQRAAEINSDVAKWKEHGSVGPLPFAKHRQSERATLGTAFDLYLESLKNDPDGKDWQYALWQFDKYLSHMRERELRAITVDEIRQLHASLAKHPTTANRAVEKLRCIFNDAIARGLATTNPAEKPHRKKMKFRERKRKRWVEPSELPRFFAALAECRHADLRDFVIVSLFTGARKENVLSIRGKDVSLADNKWRIPKPKNKEPYEVPLLPEVKHVLEKRIARHGDGFLFPSGTSATGYIADPQRPWDALRKRAGIPDVHVHDLRRTFGSYQAATGASLAIIGKSLGHLDMSSTQIYSELNLDPVRAQSAPLLR